MLSFQDLRARVATSVEALSGFRESRWSASLLGSDPNMEAHKSFAVDVPTSRILNGGTRQKTSEGLLVESTVEVSYLYAVRGDAQVGDMSAALETDLDVVSAVLAVSRHNLSALLFDSRAHSLLRGGDGSWRLCRLTFRAVHQVRAQSV